MVRLISYSFCQIFESAFSLKCNSRIIHFKDHTITISFDLKHFIIEINEGKEVTLKRQGLESKITEQRSYINIFFILSFIFKFKMCYGLFSISKPFRKIFSLPN